MLLKARRITRRAAILPALLVVTACLWWGGASAFAADRPEVLRYEVTWNGSKAGHGDITTERNAQHVNVQAQAVSDGMLKAIVEIWSRVQATFTAKTFKPQTYRYHLKSNLMRHELVDLNFDHQTKLVQINKQKGDERDSHAEKFTGLYDPITAIFLLRNQKDLSKPMFVDIFDGKDKSRLFVAPCGNESVTTKAGQHRAIMLNLRLARLGGDERELATGRLWISDDQHRIPLLLTSSPGVGTIRFELVQAQL